MSNPCSKGWRVLGEAGWPHGPHWVLSHQGFIPPDLLSLCPCLPPHLAVTHLIGSTSNVALSSSSTFCWDTGSASVGSFTSFIPLCFHWSHLYWVFFLPCPILPSSPFHTEGVWALQPHAPLGSFQIHQWSAFFSLALSSSHTVCLLLKESNTLPFPKNVRVVTHLPGLKTFSSIY